MTHSIASEKTCSSKSGQWMHAVAAERNMMTPWCANAKYDNAHTPRSFQKPKGGQFGGGIGQTGRGDRWALLMRRFCWPDADVTRNHNSFLIVTANTATQQNKIDYKLSCCGFFRGVIDRSSGNRFDLWTERGVMLCGAPN